MDPLKEKFETRIAAYDYTLEKLGKRIFALEDNLETALHKILEQQSTIKKLSYAQVFIRQYYKYILSHLIVRSSDSVG